MTRGDDMTYDTTYDTAVDERNAALARIRTLMQQHERFGAKAQALRATGEWYLHAGSFVQAIREVGESHRHDRASHTILHFMRGVFNEFHMQWEAFHGETRGTHLDAYYTLGREYFDNLAVLEDADDNVAIAEEQ